MNMPAKTSPVFEPRPLYGIGTVARLTGLKPDTLRVWERRYGLGASHKSASGRRQYTQADLEHLQLIAALVSDGARIGEIASAERKTLEHLIKGRGKALGRRLPARKPKVLFVGTELCDWLDQHQGVISGVSAMLFRCAITDVLDDFSEVGEIDMLVADCPTLSTPQINAIDSAAATLAVSNTLVTYRFANDKWLAELQRRGASGLEFPVEPARLAYEISKVTLEAEVEKGNANLGELVKAKPRMYTDGQLQAASQLKGALDCECPRHIATLIKALSEFETYSTECSVDNWHDAAIHASIFTYANQARYLMEKAMGAILEEHTEVR